MKMCIGHWACPVIRHPVHTANICLNGIRGELQEPELDLSG